MMNRRIALAICICGLFIQLGCQSPAVPTPTVVPSPFAPTLAPAVTSTPLPSPTLVPTHVSTMVPSTTPLPPTLTLSPGRPGPTTVPTLASRPATLRGYELVGWSGGSLSSALAVSDAYAYLAVGPRLLILDIANAARPVIIGQSTILPNAITDVAASNDFAYLATGSSGLFVLDIADARHPVVIGQPITIEARRLALDRSFLYVATDDGLRVYNIASPSRPALVSTLAANGGFWNVAIAGKVAFVIGDGVRMVDVSNPSQPAVIGSYTDIVNPAAIAVSGKYAWIGTGYPPKNSMLRASVQVVDVSSPAKPVRVNTISMDGPVNSIVIRDNIIFLAAVAQLQIVNIADPTRPVNVSMYKSSAEITDISFAGKRVLLTSSNGDSLRIVDIERLESPRLAGTFSTPKAVYRVAVRGRYAFVSDAGRGLVVLDVSDPTAPVPVASSPPFYAWDIELQGDYAYLGTNDRMLIFNIADPLHPVEVGSVPLHDAVGHVAAAGNRAYVAAGKEFAIVDITHPNAPTILSTITRPDTFALDVAVSEHLALIASGHGLRVLDVADAVHPKELGFLPTPQWAFGVSAAGNYAYVAASSAGLRIVDVSDPARPTEIGFAPTSNALGVTLGGSQAFVSDGGWGFRIVDISSPRKPVVTESVTGQFSARRVTASGAYAFVADTRSGLLIFRRGD